MDSSHISHISYYALPSLVCLTLIVLCRVVLQIRSYTYRKPLPGIPFDSESTKSWLGDVGSLRTDPDGLAKWCSKHLTKLNSPVCQVLMGPFSKPLVLVADVGRSRDIMMRSTFERSTYIIDRFPLFGESQICMHTNDDWKTSRSWLKDLLSPRYMEAAAAPAIHGSVRRLIELWDAKSRLSDQGRAFSMQQDLKFMAVDIMTQFHQANQNLDSALDRQLQHIQHVELGDLKLVYGDKGDIVFPRAPIHGFSESVMDIADRMAAIYTMSYPPRLVSWFTRYIMPHYRRLFSIKQSFIGGHIKDSIRRLHKGDEASSAVDHMVYREATAAQKAGRQPRYLKQTMIDEVFGNHIAGVHTTSSAMVWILKYLTENPNVQTELRSTLQEAFPAAVKDEDRLPTASEIMKAHLPYLDAVVEETLRLRAAFLIARDTTEDTNLLGYMIPKGTVCLLVCQGVDDLASVLPEDAKAGRKYPGDSNHDLEAFDPNRWLVHQDGKLKFDGSSRPQLAFGLGARACWGRKVAELEMRMMTVMVTWHFNLQEVPKALAGHEAQYDFSHRALSGYLKLQKRVV